MMIFRRLMMMGDCSADILLDGLSFEIEQLDVHSKVPFGHPS